ncbi:hypothetical protein [Sphingomonas hankookensis]|uniref:hypothetical protein n=1 Tax=Sphingomonas hankookensis TaxID=563996 RepID=UPI003D3019B7
MLPGGSSIHEPQVVINPPGTPTTALDPNDITGVGQMFISQGGGSLGLCTGTLVNPRMVILAAHCMNTRPASAYGTEAGNTPMAFGFKGNNLPGVRDWLFGNAATGVVAFRSTPANAFYNVNQVSYLTDLAEDRKSRLPAIRRRRCNARHAGSGDSGLGAAVLRAARAVIDQPVDRNRLSRHHHRLWPQRYRAER